MWTVLLVEDEELVRSHIRKHIDWERAGFHIVGEASNGLEAVALVRSLRPDLVVADIMMPVMDGVELLKTCRAESSEAMFIMLTCANDFEYAREALEYGASNYILKLSMTAPVMQEVLAKAAAELEKRRRQLQERLRAHGIRAYGQLWELAKVPGIDAADEEVRVEAILRTLPLHELPPRLIVLLLIKGGSTVEQEEAERLGGEGAVAYVYRQDGIDHFFIWTHETVWTGAEQVKAWGYRFAWAWCAAPQRIVPVWRTVYEALHVSWYEIRTRAERERLAASFRERGGPPALSYAAERDMVQLLELLQPEACLAKLERLWREMAERGIRLHTVRQAALRLLRLAASVAGQPERVPDALLQAINHRQTGEALAVSFREYAWELRNKRGLWTDHAQINQIIGHVYQHYREPITLESMAKLVSMDMYYLSALFKRKTGDSFVHFLQKVRVEQAKAHLRGTRWSLSEIAEKVGFVQDSYLTKIFKRWTGMTPGEYRREAGQPRA